MSTHSIGAFIQHESSPSANGVRLAPVLRRDEITSKQPFEVELDELRWGQCLNGPREQVSGPPVVEDAITPTARDLEQSLSSSSKHDKAVDAIVQSATNPPRNRWRLASTALMFVLIGANDAVTGALIPHIESHYHINYAITSLLFITYAIGFVLAAPMLDILDSRLGRSRLYMIASLCLCVGYVIIICQPPFPVMVLSFLFLGWGAATLLASANSWLVNLVNGTMIISFMQGFYGIGGTVAPLIATAMVSRGVRWSFFYLITLAVAMVLVLFLGWSYKGFEGDAAVQLHTVLSRTASRQAAGEGKPTKMQLLKTSLKSRTTVLGAIFIFFYQGSEVAISGWVISYLIHIREGQPSQVGNVTAGFWGGITLGRFLIVPLAQRIGLKTSSVCLIIGAAVFQSLVWAIPDIITNAVAESIVGFFLGPVCPLAFAVFSQLWPRNIQISGLSLVTSMGSSGGALVPFVTGLMAQRLTTVVLHPIALFSFAMMLVAWLSLPKVVKRTE